MALVKLQVSCRVNCSPCNTLLPFFSISLTLCAVAGNLLIRQKQKKQVDRHYFLPRKTSLWGACKSCSHCSCKQFITSPPTNFPWNLYFLQGHNIQIYIARSYLCWRKQPIQQYNDHFCYANWLLSGFPRGKCRPCKEFVGFLPRCCVARMSQ